MINPWLGIGFVLALLFGLLSVLRMYRRSSNAHPEVVRKLLHIGMGLGTLTFPWLFHTAWSVLLLLLLVLLLLLALRSDGWLRAHFGGVLDGVARHTSGEFYFAPGVAAVFLLAHGEKLLFVIPVLLLTLADSSAALIGLRYGRRHYPTGDGEKSLEGSLACFLAAALCTFLPLRFSGGDGLAESLLISLNLGLLVMLLESLARNGADNLLIPVGSSLLLRSILTRDIIQLSLVLIVLMVTITCFVVRIRFKESERQWVVSVKPGGGEG